MLEGGAVVAMRQVQMRRIVVRERTSRVLEL